MGIRSVFGCITGHKAEKEGYTELVYDEKTAALYRDDEPYCPPDSMDCLAYYAGQDADGAGGYQCPAAYAPTYQPPQATSDPASRDTRSVEDVAREVARLLWRAEWNDDELQADISAAVGPERRWTRKLVEECLDNVIEYVERGRHSGMGAAMQEALDRATAEADAAFEFPRRHPESLDGFIAIVSAGVLADMQGAWVLELLGFGEVRGKEALDGPGGGEVAMLTSDKITYSPWPKPRTFAAWWTRAYMAYIPPDSVYNYLQRMDMVDPED
ncbi:hypothetical protein VTJ49DRAFT_3820 [Mycothermus thermophilus]|uniref:Uncharacterized protein n=1 Tax=Humicola insolens TaxID=85995 RepID=A0ABR3VQI6_HUMIN